MVLSLVDKLPLEACIFPTDEWARSSLSSLSQTIRLFWYSGDVVLCGTLRLGANGSISIRERLSAGQADFCSNSQFLEVSRQFLSTQTSLSLPV
jgi:hypothetical protein